MPGLGVIVLMSTEPPPSETPLNGRKILIVEDEAPIALNLAAAVQQAGGIVIGPVASVAGVAPPEVHIVQPTPGIVVTDNFVTIRYSIRPAAGHAITARAVDYSLDGGDSWTPATTPVCADSGRIWDLAGGAELRTLEGYVRGGPCRGGDARWPAGRFGLTGPDAEGLGSGWRGRTAHPHGP